MPLETGEVASPRHPRDLWLLQGDGGPNDPTREAHDILWGHLACLQALGVVPKKGVCDNEGALVSRRGGKATFTEPFQRFRKVWETRARVIVT